MKARSGAMSGGRRRSCEGSELGWVVRCAWVKDTSWTAVGQTKSAWSSVGHGRVGAALEFFLALKWDLGQRTQENKRTRRRNNERTSRASWVVFLNLSLISVEARGVRERDWKRVIARVTFAS